MKFEMEAYMNQGDFSVIPFGTHVSVVIRVYKNNEPLICFCFSQVSVVSFLRLSFRESWIKFIVEEKVVQKYLDNEGIPDFDTEDEILIDGFPGRILSGCIDSLRKLSETEHDYKELYSNFQNEFTGCYSLPNPPRAKKGNVDIKEFSAAFAEPNPFEAMFFFSKRDALYINRRFAGKKIRKEIVRSQLPYDSIEPAYFFDGKTAELISFLLWLHAHY